ncbi:site-specific integrase [Gelidibacter gilvus]|uniref:Site-specific integrase n=1 Tax=Gelidibacter gilvus TaxID=59602 RepID=A0A4Q0XMX8_9FLAO|nr:site-specific integrase [Gelidibacter gilvus]RXJ52626.1 site-specific integrase [Gelidibacter gilvus]
MASIKILLRKKPNIQGECPIVMRIVKDRKSKLISLGIATPLADWDDKANKFKRSHPNWNQRNRIILELEQKALKIIDDFMATDTDFTLEQFEEQMKGVRKNNMTVSQFWNHKIEELIQVGRTGNARAHKDTYTSFFKFHKSKSLKFHQITPDLLFRYETYLRTNGNQDGGIGVKMRELRALFNEAIERGITNEKYYPFKIYKVSKLKSNNIKKALSREQIKLMENLDTEQHPHLMDTQNYMVFSYYTGGMNFVDMMKLKWSNIEEDRILYKRSKTKGRFSVKIMPPVKKVIDFYRKKVRKTEYVFPILLSDELTPIQIENRKLKTLKKFNKQLKEIASIQGINSNVTSYTIRHSFATNLKYAGISMDVIGETMGHQNVNVTRAYLKEFENEVLDSAMEKLLEEDTEEYAYRIAN